MPSTASPRLRTEQQALGENLSSWGYPKLNDALLRLEEAIAGVAPITLTGPTYTLNVQNFNADEARMAVLVFSGTLSAPCTVTTPAVQKEYLVINKTGQNVILSTGAGATALCRPGVPTAFYCDASNWLAQDPTLDQIKTAAAPVNVGGFEIQNAGQATSDSGVPNRGQVNALTAANVQLASDWAQKTSGSVDGANGYSARLWATSTTALAGGFKGAYGYALDAASSASTAGTQAGNAASSATSASGSAGLAQQWATTTGAQVAATDYSAKEWAVGTVVPAGSAKSWAQAAAISATNAANSATAAQNAAGAVKVSATDTTPGNLLAKLAQGTGITFTRQNAGSNETLRLDVPLTVPRLTPMPKTSAYSFAAADIGSLFSFTGGPYTIGAISPATLGAGWWTQIRNSGTGWLTFTPGSGITIDGRASILVYPGETLTLATDGANFISSGRSRLVLMRSVIVLSAVSTVAFTGIADPELTEIFLEAAAATTTTTSSSLLLQTSHGGAFQTTYERYFITTGSGVAGSGTNAGGAIVFANNNSGGQNQTSGVARFLGLQSAAARFPQVICDTVSFNPIGSAPTRTLGAGAQISSANLFDGIQVLADAGTIASGTFNLYGRR